MSSALSAGTSFPDLHDLLSTLLPQMITSHWLTNSSENEYFVMKSQILKIDRHSSIWRIWLKIPQLMGESSDNNQFNSGQLTQCTPYTQIMQQTNKWLPYHRAYLCPKAPLFNNRKLLVRVPMFHFMHHSFTWLGPSHRLVLAFNCSYCMNWDLIKSATWTHICTFCVNWFCICALFLLYFHCICTDASIVKLGDLLSTRLTHPELHNQSNEFVKPWLVTRWLILIPIGPYMINFDFNWSLNYWS